MNVSPSIHLTLPSALPYPLTYRLPPSIPPRTLIGHRAVVPLKNKLAIGIITAITSSLSSDAKEILHIPDKEPILPPAHLQFLQWISQYYLCPLGQVIRTALFPQYHTIQLSLHQSIHAIKATPTEKPLLQALAKQPLTYPEALDYLPNPKLLQCIKTLLSQKALSLCPPIFLAQKAIALPNHFLSNKDTPPEDKQTHITKTPAQKKLFHTYITLTKALNQRWITKEVLLQQGISPQIITWALKTHPWQTKNIPFQYSPAKPQNPPPSTLEQKAILQAIQPEKFKNKSVAFLATPNHHTQATLHTTLAIESIIHKKNNILLVPNIEALNLWQQHLYPVLHDNLLIWSSQKKQYLHALKQSKGFLILAMPSILLHPLHNIHRITITQENSPDYKKKSIPYYHIRDIAILCTQYYPTHVLLTGTSPTLETYYNIQKGKYTPLTYPLIESTHTPSLQIITRPRNHLILTPRLLETLEKTLTQKKKIVILHPRRGYTAYTSCQQCHWQATCPSCTTGLVHHQDCPNLQCHHCQRTFPIPHQCPKCKATQLKYSRIGIQQLQENLILQIPHIRLARIDQDETPSLTKYKQTLDAFKKGTLNCLIGTHRLLRALPSLDPTLILWIDPHHWTPKTDFRATIHQRHLLEQLLAHKNAYTLLISTPPTQRHTIAPLIQPPNTFYPETLQACQTHEYPPYIKLVKINLQHHKQIIALQAAHQLAITLQQQYQLKALGPSLVLPKPNQKQFTVALWVHLTHQSAKKALPTLAQNLTKIPIYQFLKVYFDVDPR